MDADPQASLTTAFGLTDHEGLLYQAMIRRGPLPVVYLAENLSISPSSIDLSRGETQFISLAGREYLLQACLERTELVEDTTVILDFPPSLGVLSLSCLTAADYACVVVQPGGFEIRTLAHLHETVPIAASDNATTASLPHPPAPRTQRARLGRPPHSAVRQNTPKEKVTLRIRSDLIAEYRDWSWEARCQLRVVATRIDE
jgi:cellulose biosynthesis protein BcsQ